MLFGLLDLSVKNYIIATIVLTQISIAGVTIYLHRCQTHQALSLHPIMSHFFRFWLWLTTGLRTKEWVAIHRKHHAKCETPEDPHSPKILGLKKILLEGAEVYRAAKTPETIEHYGHGTPDDWVEKNIYTRFDKLGISIMFVADLILFGIPGISIWAIQMMWIPLFAAGVVNGLGHSHGYRNFESKDRSTNVFPLAFFIGGEELHNNHHAFPASAKLSAKWWEFDMGWFYIQIMSFLKLAKVKRVMPKLAIKNGKAKVDLDTLKVVISHQLQVMADYNEQVILPMLMVERDSISNEVFFDIKKLITGSESLDVKTKQRISSIIQSHLGLAHVYRFKVALQEIWAKTTATQQELLEALKHWHTNAAEDSNLFLKKFAFRLSHYSA